MLQSNHETGMFALLFGIGVDALLEIAQITLYTFKTSRWKAQSTSTGSQQRIASHWTVIDRRNTADARNSVIRCTNPKSSYLKCRKIYYIILVLRELYVFGCTRVCCPLEKFQHFCMYGAFRRKVLVHLNKRFSETTYRCFCIYGYLLPSKLRSEENKDKV